MLLRGAARAASSGKLSLYALRVRVQRGASPAFASIAVPRIDVQRYAFFSTKRKDPFETPRREEDEESGKQPSRAGKLGAAAATASVLFGKTKYVLAALKLTKMTPLISMMLTSATYSLFFGWPYSLGMVGLIFVHEAGHAVAMRHYGVPFAPMVFVPFMGAVIAMKDHPRSVNDEAWIALAGPALGSVGALGINIFGVATDSQLCYALADFGYMINLFNLLPIGSLDGGRISSALSPAINVAGLGIGGALIYAGAISNPIFYLIMLSGTYTTASRIFGWQGGPHESYYRIRNDQKMRIGAGYIGLIAALVLAMRNNNSRRKTPRQMEAERSRESNDDDERAANLRGGDTMMWRDGSAINSLVDDTTTTSSTNNNSDELYDDFFFSFEDPPSEHK